ncbi:AraC family transcriptional regulator [Flavisericum labens]|uniref:AraC family transcriptional regulator n=1 Tax=Flavisericum labens TaxID=3377112 RepID=UPI00387B7192
MKQINRMLLEMASGNFFYRLERSSRNDTTEALMVTLNMLAEEIEAFIKHQGYVNTDSSIVNVVQMSFLLDHNGSVAMANQEGCNILSVLRSDILGRPFGTLLTETSRSKWQRKWIGLQKKSSYDTNIELLFKTVGKLTVPKLCYITTFEAKGEERKTLVTAIHQANSQELIQKRLKGEVIGHSKKRESPAAHKKSRPRLSFEDVRKIRKAHDIILENLESELPSLKEFALQLGTNEFKLKYGFKELYGTTVHRFLLRERLRKAQMMIQFSDRSIKAIAHMTGFKSTAHFSRSFKKHFGYTPSELQKKAFGKDR